jgi:hypothetical protein
MDVAGLRAGLEASTRRVIGQIGQTVDSQAIHAPAGFGAVDVYSSTASALRLLTRPNVPGCAESAIQEFNEESASTTQREAKQAGIRFSWGSDWQTAV